jgi:large subunit ribosomal protein L1
MDKSQVTKTLKKVKENSPKRKFTQSIDLIINLKDIDIKKSEQSINLFHTLHYSKGKKVKICALVGPELLTQAKEVCDLAISVEEFPNYKKKEAKKLATDYDFFIAQATVMPKLATAFGRVFGPKGKMPNPKAGCVVPPNASLKPIYERLQKTIKLQTINDANIQTIVGNEEMKEEEVVDNIMTTYEDLINHLPSGHNNIKSVMLKLTMGKTFLVGKVAKKGKEEDEEPTKEAKPKGDAPKAEEKPAKKEDAPTEEPKEKPKAEAPAKEVEEAPKK